MPASPPLAAATAPAPESLSTLRRSIFAMSFPPYSSLESDFPFEVEEVQPRRVQRQAQPVAHRSAFGRLDCRHHRVFADRDVEQDLRAQFLHNLDDRVETQFGR